MGRYGPGVTYMYMYTVPRRATINAPPPMGLLGGVMGDPGASLSKYPRGSTIPKGGLTLNPNPSDLQIALSDRASAHADHSRRLESCYGVDN